MILKYSFEQLMTIIDAHCLEKSPDFHEFFLMTDSRTQIHHQNPIFFAISGPRNNGHNYIQNLINRGVKIFIVDEDFIEIISADCCYLKVENTLKALQKLAGWHRRHSKALVIGITGSNGKTMVKEWAYELLKPSKAVFRSPKSYNSQIGVALSLLMIQPHHEIAIIEAGISTISEMRSLQKMIMPELGVFTNIGTAHNDGFNSIEEKIGEKAILFESANRVIYPAGDHRIQRILTELDGPSMFSWGTQVSSHFALAVDSINDQNASITITKRGEKYSFVFPFVDDIMLDNAIQATIIAMMCKMKPSEIQEGIASLKPISSRIEKVEGKNGCIIVNDSYSADLVSFRSSVNAFKIYCSLDKTTLVLTDFEEDSKNKTDLSKAITDIINSNGFNRLIYVGEQFGEIDSQLSPYIKKVHFKNTQLLLEQINTLDFEDEGILIKGANSFGLGKLVSKLSKQSHQTCLEIDLNAIGNNLRLYYKYKDPATKMMVMVKAGSYGSGLTELASFLEFSQVDYLGVAYIDEGIQLRQSGIRLPILVLNLGNESFEPLIQYNLEPEIYSLSQLKSLTKFIQSKGISEFQVHLKFDSGMHRLGFVKEENAALLEWIKDHSKVIKIKGLMSHLAASDSASHREFTRMQCKDFEDWAFSISKAIEGTPIRHIMNSGGMLHYPEFHFDMVRLGIGLYGIDSHAVLRSNLERVHTLKTFISQVREYEAGTTIGYSRNGVLNRKSKIATIGIGYADGLLRRAGNGKFSVMIKGLAAPIIGNVCMDMCMVDVTDIQGVSLQDEVLIFGKEYPIEHLAMALDTIPYEVLTSISHRVKRVYVE